MRWDAQDVSDDHGINARREQVHTACDDAGQEWIVAKHDDGSWNWMRWAPGGNEPLDMGQGFETADLALASAERHAAQLAAAAATGARR